MEIKTLDQRIRDKARAKYDRDTTNFRAQAFEILGLDRVTQTDLPSAVNAGKMLTAGELIDALIRTSTSKVVAKREQQAVDSFLKDFEELRARPNDPDLDNL